MWRIRDEQAGDEEAIFAVHAAAFPTDAKARLVEALRDARHLVLGEPSSYRRFGFVPASRFALVDEYGGDDAFMAQATSPGGLDGVRGLVRYGLEFAAL